MTQSLSLILYLSSTDKSTGTALTDKDVMSKISQQRSDSTKPIVVVKHHQMINFTAYAHPNSAYYPEFPIIHNLKFISFNLIRHPVDRWISAYNFCRGGMRHDPTPRDTCKGMTQEQLDMTPGEYFENNYWIGQRYSWFFGWLITDDCQFCNQVKWEKNQDWMSRPVKAATYTWIKEFILSNPEIIYHLGVLEELELSLKLFSTLMPDIFSNMNGVLQTEEVKKAIRNSKSVKNHTVSDEVYHQLAVGPFKYEVDLYNFIKNRFYDYVKLLKLE